MPELSSSLSNLLQSTLLAGFHCSLYIPERKQESPSLEAYRHLDFHSPDSGRGCGHMAGQQTGSQPNVSKGAFSNARVNASQDHAGTSRSVLRDDEDPQLEKDCVAGPNFLIGEESYVRKQEVVGPNSPIREDSSVQKQEVVRPNSPIREDSSVQKQEVVGPISPIREDLSVQKQEVVGPKSPIREDSVVKKREDVKLESEDGPAVPVPETPVALFEKRKTRSATSLTQHKLETDAAGAGAGAEAASFQPILEERKQCSSVTSAIIRRLLQKRSIPTSESTKMR
jgi:hypothetical protein